MSPDSSAKKWRILCIDDDPDLLFIVKAALGTEHEVVEATDGLQAVSMLDFCDADFVICDVRMPGLDGFQTVEAIRRHPAYANVPVFFLTAETDRSMAKRGFASGANLYLTKPFDPMRLLKNVNYFLQESGQQPLVKRLSPEQVLQALRPAQAAPATPKATAPRGSDKARAIVISANQAQLDRVALALEGGFECVLAADPLASLQKLFRYEPDILMVNPAIPRLSGWGLVQMISNNPRLKGLTIILMEDEWQPLDPRLVPAISRQPLLPASASQSDILGAVESAVQSPGFVIRPKTASFIDLLQEEDDLRCAMERDRARQEELAEARQQRYRRIQSFIDDRMK